MELFSSYLGETINIPDAKEYEGPRGEKYTILPYQRLESILHHHPTCKANGVHITYSAQPGNSGLQHVWTCVISDTAGNRVESIGEANARNLFGPIAQAYPSLMAHKRAFSAAAILFLDLPDDITIYSDQQFSAELGGCAEGAAPNTEAAPTPVEETPKTAAEEKSETADALAATISVPEPVAESVTLPWDDDATTAFDGDIESLVGEEPPAELAGEVVPAALENAQKTVLNFGKYKGKTLVEVYAENKSYLNYIIDKGRDEALKTVAKAYLEYAKTVKA